MAEESTTSDDPALADTSLEKRVRLNELLDLYGDLLTDKQQRLARLHLEQDLSFAEIAHDEMVSRQAVHDAVKHATLTLEKIESRLKLLEESKKKARDLSASDGAASEASDAREVLVSLRDRVRRSAGVLYTTDWIVKELDRAVSILERKTSQ